MKKKTRQSKAVSKPESRQMTLGEKMVKAHAANYSACQHERRICAWCGNEDLPMIGEMQDSRWVRFYCSATCFEQAFNAMQLDT